MLEFKNPEKAKIKTVSIYPSIEKYIIKLSKKYNISQSKVIAEGIKELVEKEDISFIEEEA